jgi:hypothetical protein
VTVEAVATDNIHPAGREWRARGQIKVATGQGQHAIWRWRGKARGQITVATIKQKGTTYTLEVERKDEVRSQCNCKGGRDDIHAEGGEGGQEVRSQLQLLKG